jgi:GT2 family glycosyltransferase
MSNPDLSAASDLSVRPELSILVVSYNTREMTLACLRSVLDQTRCCFEILVVDNASQDGSAVAIAEAFPPGSSPVTLMAEVENHGFAKANNLAAARARGAMLLLLNPDTLVLDGAVDRLAAFARSRPEARIWGGRTVFGDGRLNPASCWQRMGLWALITQATGLSSIFRGSEVFNPEGFGGWDRSTERQVDIVSGCFLMISRADWQALGGFHPDFFMYGEEADLCLRAGKLLGARPRVTPQATIVHYAGASERVRSDKMVRLLKAKRLLILRHFPAWQQPLALGLFSAWPLSRWLALSGFGLTGWPSWKAGAKTWGEIWARRGEWRADLG